MLNVVMPSVNMLGVLMLNVVMLGVIMLGVIMLNVVMQTVVRPSVTVPPSRGLPTLRYIKIFTLILILGHFQNEFGQNLINLFSPNFKSFPRRRY
jgi:hypothetical protein